jgi:hypothetical protein
MVCSLLVAYSTHPRHLYFTLEVKSNTLLLAVLVSLIRFHSEVHQTHLSKFLIANSTPCGNGLDIVLWLTVSLTHEFASENLLHHM